jgi:uncharacterized phage protein (TIGR02216 family)|nr:MAG: phage tail assembly chaperone [Pseudomonadota bacterium]
MALGFGVLRLSPAAFWAMTPKELEAALSFLSDRTSISRPSREDLVRLMEAYPDV